MAELRTMVADLMERQRSSAPAPPPPEAEENQKAEEQRRQLLILEARSSTVERARPPLAHEAENEAPIPAPRRIVAAKTYSGPKKSATPAKIPAATASTSAAARASKPAPAKKPTSAPAPRTEDLGFKKLEEAQKEYSKLEC
ncbi:skin secretory protein xP2-like [Bombyx mori]|uniref:skin secretory protein xP2-like n=1 Tax=Bombyx mori TaxID=7091 RepID=UPI002ED532B6